MNNENSTAIVKQEFGANSIERSGETNSTSMEAGAKASIQARYVMALQRPRNWDDVRSKIMLECQRTGFADAARYRKPIGKGIEGPSIRFAEACVRYAGNMDVAATPVFEDVFKRVLLVSATDFETNASYSATITLEKTVERRDPAERVVRGSRKNSTGDTVYIVEATEDELLNKQNAMVSKSVRTLSLRLIPGDIIEEAMDECIKTLKNRAEQDPAGERKRLCDAFAKLGIMPTQIATYLGHPLEAINPAELTELRGVYASIKDGETTWAATTETKKGPGTAKAKSKTEELVEKVNAKKGTKAAPEPTASTDDEYPEEQEKTQGREPGSDDV